MQERNLIWNCNWFYWTMGNWNGWQGLSIHNIGKWCSWVIVSELAVLIYTTCGCTSFHLWPRTRSDWKYISLMFTDWRCKKCINCLLLVHGGTVMLMQSVGGCSKLLLETSCEHCSIWIHCKLWQVMKHKLIIHWVLPCIFAMWSTVY
jgi:hypothetical protein